MLALLNIFGQRPETSTGAAAAAQLSVSAPSRVRGGLLYQARFNIAAKKPLDQAELVLARGWIHDLTINTMEPSPTSETSQDGKLGLDLGPIPAGQTYVLFIDYQVNPTNVGRQDQTGTLYDATPRPSPSIEPSWSFHTWTSRSERSSCTRSSSS